MSGVGDAFDAFDAFVGSDVLYLVVLHLICGLLFIYSAGACQVIVRAGIVLHFICGPSSLDCSLVSRKWLASSPLHVLVGAC